MEVCSNNNNNNNNNRRRRRRLVRFNEPLGKSEIQKENFFRRFSDSSSLPVSSQNGFSYRQFPSVFFAMPHKENQRTNKSDFCFYC